MSNNLTINQSCATIHTYKQHFKHVEDFMILADFIQEYLVHQGQELTEQQRMALEMLEKQYPNETWSLKETTE